MIPAESQAKVLDLLLHISVMILVNPTLGFLVAKISDDSCGKPSIASGYFDE